MRSKFLLVFILLILIGAGLFFSKQIVDQRENGDTQKAKKTENINITVASDISGYEIQVNDFDLLDGYINQLGINESGIFDFDNQSWIKPVSVKIYLTDQPQLYDRFLSSKNQEIIHFSLILINPKRSFRG